MAVTITHTVQLPAESVVHVGTPDYWNGNIASMTVPSGTVVGNLQPSDGPAEEITSSGLTAWLDVFTDTVQGVVPASGGGTTNFLRADGTWAAAGGGSGASATTVEIDLGSAKFSGKFTITDAAITSSSKVLCWQAPGPYTGKGTLADEAEMQPVQVISVEPGSGSAVVKWQTPPTIVVAPVIRRLAPNTGSGTLANSGTNRDILRHLEGSV